MEPNEALDPETLGLFASTGLQKGKPFAPDERMKKILIEAVAVGNATARAFTFRSRDQGTYIYPGSSWWIPAGYGSGYEFLLEPGIFDLDRRTAMFYWATGIRSMYCAGGVRHHVALNGIALRDLARVLIWSA